MDLICAGKQTEVICVQHYQKEDITYFLFLCLSMGEKSREADAVILLIFIDIEQSF